jgi:hypothetical protein
MDSSITNQEVGNVGVKQPERQASQGNSAEAPAPQGESQVPQDQNVERDPESEKGNQGENQGSQSNNQGDNTPHQGSNQSNVDTSDSRKKRLVDGDGGIRFVLSQSPFQPSQMHGHNNQDQGNTRESKKADSKEPHNNKQKVMKPIEADDDSDSSMFVPDLTSDDGSDSDSGSSPDSDAESVAAYDPELGKSLFTFPAAKPTKDGKTVGWAGRYGRASRFHQPIWKKGGPHIQHNKTQADAFTELS